MSTPAKKALLFLLTAAVLSGCGKDEPPADPTPTRLEMTVRPMVNGEPMVPNQVYHLPNGRPFKIETLEFYMGDAYLATDNGGMTDKLDSILFYTPRKTNLSPWVNTRFTFDIQQTISSKLKMGVGVPQRMNSMENPDFEIARYPYQHPLSVDQNTFWGWASGYSFFRIEGRIDGSEGMDQPPTKQLSYHIGLDQFYLPLTLDLPTNIKAGQTNKTVLEVDIVRLFDNINLPEESITHTTASSATQMELSERLRINMAHIFSLKEGN